MQQPTGDVHVVADFGDADWSDLELPLTGHHFGVRSGDLDAGVEAGLCVLLDNVTADNATGTNAAVVRTLRGGEAAAGREPEWAAIETQHRVLLLEPEPHVVSGEFFSRHCSGCTRVGRVRLHVRGQVDLTHHEHVPTATDRIRAGEDGLEHAVRLVASGLVGRRTVEPPDRHFGYVILNDLGLVAEHGCWLSSIEPDVFSLVRHEGVLPRYRCRGERVLVGGCYRGRRHDVTVRLPPHVRNVNAV